MSVNSSSAASAATLAASAATSEADASLALVVAMPACVVAIPACVVAVAAFAEAFWISVMFVAFVFTDVILVATVLTLDISPATVPMSAPSAATVLMLAAFTATAITLPISSDTIEIELTLSARESMSAITAGALSTFISDTASAVPKRPISVDTPETVVTSEDIPATTPMSVPSAATVVTSEDIPETVVTSLFMPATVVMLALFPATVLMFDVLPATVVTLEDMPETVLTSVRIVFTFVMASVATVPSWISAKVLISAEIVASESTSESVGPGSGSPVVSLNPSTVPLRSSLSGSSKSVNTSPGFTNKPRPSFSSSCWVIITLLSSCSFKLEARRSPAVTKSVVRESSRPPMIVRTSDAMRAAVRVIDPVPFALILTV